MSTYDFAQHLALVKAESTYGTDPTVAFEDLVVLSGAPQLTPLAGNWRSREYADGLAGAKEEVLGSPHGVLALPVELAGASAAGVAPQWAALLLACGFAETIVADTSVTYAPVSASYSSCAAQVNIDGVDQEHFGVRGNAVLEGRGGEVPKLNFAMLGIRQAVAAVTQPSGTLPTVVRGKEVSGVNTTVTLAGTALCVSDFQIDLGRSPVFDDIAGCREVRVNSRAMSGRMTVDLPTIATKNLIEEALAYTRQALVLTHGVGASAGQVITITAPKVQMKPGQLANRNGVLSLPIDLVITPDSGDDEISIAIT